MALVVLGAAEQSRVLLLSAALVARVLLASFSLSGDPMKYAYFDPNSKVVMAWLDTAAYSYPELPTPSMLIEVDNDDDWHQGDGKDWYVVQGALTTVAPVPVVDANDVAARQAADARNQRGALLQGSDWLVVRHRDQLATEGVTVLTTGQYTAVLDYRQALRNLPKQAGFPGAITWPPAPV